jgi:hypothetical protein
MSRVSHHFDPVSLPLLANPPPFTHNSLQISAAGGFMTICGFGNFRFGLILATAFAATMWSTAGSAYTPEQQQACTGDAFRLCGPEIPDVDRVTVCMIRNRSQLSPGCRMFFRPGPEEVAAAPAGKPMAIKPAPRKSMKARKPRKKPKAS